MTKRIGPWLAVVATVWSLQARADCGSTLYLVDDWLRFGPTMSPMLALQNELGRVRASPLIRVGILAGLPIQLEATLSSDLLLEEASLDASAGLRLLPVSVTKHGITRGGLPGHNLGMMAGLATVGWYVGAVYEWIVLPEVGVVAELQWSFGGALREPPSLHLGAKFQLPAFSDL